MTTTITAAQLTTVLLSTNSSHESVTQDLGLFMPGED